MIRSLRFATVTALAGIVALGTGCPGPADMDGGTDARADSRTDTSSDTRTDVTSDTGSDVQVDTGTDVVTDTAVDTGTDVAMDTAVDTGTDVAMDTVVDTGTDVVMDSGADAMDAAMDVVNDTGVDTGSDTGSDAGTNVSAQIAAVRAAADGALTTPLPITGATVTYVVAAYGNDPAGFFVQGVTTGPALFVAVDPATLSPSPAVGDVVSFSVTSTTSTSGPHRADAITGFSRASTGANVESLRQDLSSATDIITALDSYDSELIHLDGTIATPFAFAGAGHQSAQITTAGITTADTNLRVRVTDAVRDSLDLVPGCTFSLGATMWRLGAQAQPSAWVNGDITVNSCPAPRLTTAIAVDATTVRLTFDRNIHPASIMANGSQFTITGPGATTLMVTAASVSGRTVTLTTAPQVPSASYTVTVAASVTDLLGVPVDATARTAMFTGYAALAVVRINEFNANITSSCDLVELRVVQGGSMGGFELRERDTQTLYTFPATTTVATNDYIVVHINGSNATCNPGTSMSETLSANQFPRTLFGANFDSAYDVYSTDSGLTNTDNVFTLYDNTGTIVDAVLTANLATGTAASASETQAAAVATAMQWTQVGGGVPTGGFVDDAFRANAVLDLDGTGMTAAGTSIQRTDNMDTNTLQGWNDTSVATWGANNPGQTNF